MALDRGLADELRVCAARHVEGGVPGLTMLVARDGAVLVEAVGSLGDRRGPTTRDTQYRIASTTKIVTALATLALVDDGRLGLDDPVETFLPAQRTTGARRARRPARRHPPGSSIHHRARPAHLHERVRHVYRYVRGTDAVADRPRGATTRPGHARTTEPDRPASARRVDRAARQTAAARRTGHSLPLQHGRVDPRRAHRPRQWHVVRGLPARADPGSARDDRDGLLRVGPSATRHRLPANARGPRARLRARRGLHAPAGLRGRRVRTRRHGGRPLRPRPAPARRGSRPRLGRRDPFDDERPAARRAEGRRRLRTRLLRRALLGLRPRREPRRLLRVGRWAGHLVPRRSTTPARGHRAHSTTLRVARDTGRAP